VRLRLKSQIPRPTTEGVEPLHPRVLVAASALTTLLLTPAPALAADAPAERGRYGEATPLRLPTEEAGPQAAGIGDGGSSLVRTLVGLAVVIAVIYGVAWLLRQMKGAREPGAAGFGLSAAATVSLGPGRSVHLIRAGRELLLVGSAEQGVVPIRTYTEDEARRLGLLEQDDLEAPRTAPRPSMGTSLVDALRSRTAR
jgi:flagellar protein FliO/FliZ